MSVDSGGITKLLWALAKDVLTLVVNSNFDGYTNSIYTITVGAIDRNNKHPSYSESCSATMIVMYSSGYGGSAIVRLVIEVVPLSRVAVSHLLPFRSIPPIGLASAPINMGVQVLRLLWRLAFTLWFYKYGMWSDRLRADVFSKLTSGLGTVLT